MKKQLRLQNKYRKIYKSFKDLLPGDESKYLKRLSLTFPNNYSISVITGVGTYSSEGKPYEIAVLHNGHLCYDTKITDDVIGYLTESDVNYYMKQIQNIKG